MPVSELSSAAQDYPKLIWSANEWSDKPITVSVMAERIGVKPSTVSDGIKRLATQGLITHAPYGSIELTDQGRAHALAMVRRHRLLETFLVQVLGYGCDEVHDEAEVRPGRGHRLGRPGGGRHLGCGPGRRRLGRVS